MQPTEFYPVFSMSTSLAKVFQNLGLSAKAFYTSVLWDIPNLVFPSIMPNSHATPVMMLSFEVCLYTFTQNGYHEGRLGFSSH